MDQVEIIILIICLVLLIGTLGAFAYFMTKVDKNVSWPPIQPACPDFWTELTDASGVCYDETDILPDKCKTLNYVNGDGSDASSGRTFQVDPDNVVNKHLAAQDANDVWSAPFNNSTTPLLSSFSNTYDPDDSLWGSYAADVSGVVLSNTYVYFDPDNTELDALEDKKTWARQCGVSWDGVSNSNQVE